MIIKLAEYKVKKKALNIVLKAISDFVRSVHKHESDTFYEAFRRGDTLEFFHLMKFKDHKAEEIHGSASYTSRFVKMLYPNCQKEPTFTDLSTIPIK